MNVGLVGCGVIAARYVRGAEAFDSFDVVACSDTDAARSEALGAEHGLLVAPVDELIADSAIDVVLNLTPPHAHAAVVGAALGAGKHVYTEKPLTTSVDEGRELLAEATRLRLRIGCAPDTFLGSAYAAARELIARGDIGEPLGASATMLVGGAETWHPNGDFFFRAGAGPMLDIAPYYLTAIASLLGPFEAATGFGSTPTPERTLAVGPRAGERFTVEVPTQVTRLRRARHGHGRLRVAQPVRQHAGGVWNRGAAFAARRERVRRRAPRTPRARRMAGRPVPVARRARDTRLRTARDGRSAACRASAPRVRRAGVARPRDGVGRAPLRRGGAHGRDRDTL